MSYVPLSSEHIPNRGIEEWTSILVDYVYQLVGDPEAVEQLVAGVLGNKALSTLSLSAADAYLQVLTDATDSACNYLILRDEADRLPPLPYHYAITGTPERMAEDSIGRAARKLPVLKRAALALSDQLSLDPSQVAQVLREPADQTARLIQEARQEYAEHLDEIVHLRGQLPLANIAPAIALGLRPRYGYAKSAYALLPPFELPADRLELLKWNALKNQEALPAQPAPRLPAQRQPAAWNWSLQPALFVGALAALMVGAWVLGRLSAATSAPAAVVIFVTATPTATREIVALPAPATSTPTPTSTATPVRAPTETPTLVPVPSAGATEVPATPSAPDATPTAEETDEPELPLSPTGTSTPRIVRRVVPRPTSTPTRIIYVAVPTRTPTRVPTRTPTAVAPTPLPTSTPTATVAPTATATPTQALPSATPLKPPTPTATNIPPTPTRTATSVPPSTTPTKTPLPPTPTLTPTKALAAATPTKTTAPPATKTPTLTPAP